MGFSGPVLVPTSPDRPLPDGGVVVAAGDYVCQKTADLAEGERDEFAANAFGEMAAVTAR